nr:hypothetical protein [Streptomyces sp. NRRL B-1140]
MPTCSGEWWAFLPQYGGYISTLCIDSPDNRLPDFPECGSPRP